MVKRYLDTWFHTLVGNKYNEFITADEVPNNVDTVGISFYHNDVVEIQRVIDALQSKTKKLLVNLSEPTAVEIVDLIKQNSRVQFYSDIVPNGSLTNLKTSISWFITNENYYATSLWAQDLISQLTSDVTKPYTFDCLLGSSKPHRDLVETLYRDSVYEKNILFTYYKNDTSLGIWDFDHNTDLVTETNLVLGGREISKYALLPVNIYNQSYFSIVAETTAFNEFNQYTEKVAKPIIAERLFIAFCGQHYLKNLRSLGFKTFDSVIDESYDAEPDINRRFELAWQQVEYLCNLDPLVVIKELKLVTEHNRRVFFTTDWHRDVYSDVGVLPSVRRQYAPHHRYE